MLSFLFKLGILNTLLTIFTWFLSVMNLVTTQMPPEIYSNVNQIDISCTYNLNQVRSTLLNKSLAQLLLSAYGVWREGNVFTLCDCTQGERPPRSKSRAPRSRSRAPRSRSGQGMGALRSRSRGPSGQGPGQVPGGPKVKVWVKVWGGPQVKVRVTPQVKVKVQVWVPPPPRSRSKKAGARVVRLLRSPEGLSCC